MVDLKKAAGAAVGVTAISYGLGWAYNKFIADGIATLTFSAVDVNVASQIKAGVDTTLAGKLLAYMQGVIPSGGIWGALIMLYVASFLVVLIGGLIGERIALGKTDVARFGIGMGLAAGVIGLIVGSMSVSVGAVGTALAMLIYFGIVALVYVNLRRIDGVRDLLPSP